VIRFVTRLRHSSNDFTTKRAAVTELIQWRDRTNDFANSGDEPANVTTLSPDCPLAHPLPCALTRTQPDESQS
jgi:hypothetical protein